MTVRVGRAICAVLLAMAIAMLPVSAGFASAAPAAAPTVASVLQAMPDCDHHQHQAPSKQTHNTADHDACLVSCALCFGFVGAEVSGIAYAVIPGAALQPVHARVDLSSLMGSPPFRPPRS
jgi:hypothetical protein